MTRTEQLKQLCEKATLSYSDLQALDCLPELIALCEQMAGRWGDGTT
jgi:hypothetical protein